jgi:transposase-like protein
VQELLLERGITVSHETLREWNIKFADSIALEIKRRRATPGKTWHLDEMHVVRGKAIEEARGNWHRAFRVWGEVLRSITPS